MTKVTKNVSSKDDIRFKKIFKKMMNNNEFKTFHDLLNYMINNKYQIRETELKNLFNSNL